MIGPWKRRFKQDNIPLPFLQLIDHLDILGIKIYENWRTTQRENGAKVLKKVKLVADRWKGGRFNNFLLRPHMVNTYLFSNVWYSAGVVDLQLGHLDEIQKRGNQYVHSDCFLKPQNIANYLKRDQMGLGLVHVRTKAQALLIKNILGEANSEFNCYMSAVVDFFCRDISLDSEPIRPNYLTDALIRKIKLVFEKCQTLETKTIYNVLIAEEFKINDSFQLKVQLDNSQLNIDNAVSMINSKILSLKVRTNIWKQFHCVVYDDVIKGKIVNSSPVCKLCTEADVDKNHIYFFCEKYKGCGHTVLKVLGNYGQFNQNDVLNMKIGTDNMDLMWLIANYLYFVTVSRQKCSPEQLKSYLITEFEVIRRSKYCDTNLETSLKMLVDQLDTTSQQ